MPDAAGAAAPDRPQVEQRQPRRVELSAAPTGQTGEDSDSQGVHETDGLRGAGSPPDHLRPTGPGPRGTRSRPSGSSARGTPPRRLPPRFAGPAVSGRVRAVQVPAPSSTANVFPSESPNQATRPSPSSWIPLSS